jgi:hypothetical protein
MQIVRVTFPNFSANTGAVIRKVGPEETMPGHNIFYNFPLLANESSIPLSDFFFRDVLPVEAVRADRLITGTFNHSLTYRIVGNTNRGREIVIADNLSTLRNNIVEMRPAHLGLATDEFLVDFTVLFGQVPANFRSVEAPRLYVDVLNNLPHGMMFANRVDIGGRVPGTEEWVISGDTWGVTVFNPQRGRIPQSGW